MYDEMPASTPFYERYNLNSSFNPLLASLLHVSDLLFPLAGM